MFPKSLPYDYRAQRSSALVITLAAVVLISAIILVFFGQSTLHRQMSYTSAGQYRADMIAHTGLDTIVGDLRNEITAGSTVTPANGTNIYVPTANNNVVPSLVNNQGFANLVKESTSGQPFWSSGPIRSAGGNSSSTASSNGRSISLAEWNRPGLLGDRGSGATPTPVSFYPPDWVIVTRQGPIANTLNNANAGPATQAGNLDDKSPGNMYYVVGRYAYTIYDEGGLLDVNVAGYPASTILSSDSFTTKRGVLPQVDLANIPGIDSDINANALVSWRNATSASNYKAYVLGNTNGFTTVAPGDQTFISRQDLIKYALANPGTVSSKALQYLGTFSRELNAPSYTPSSTLPAADLTSQNPSLINTRVVTTPTVFTRYSDNTTAQVGEPLIKYRFPLSRLGWLSYQGITGISSGAINPRGTSVIASDIYNAFGLTINSTTTPVSWIYNHVNPVSYNGGGPTGTIMSLSAVAAAGREPDFFELLQAGILAGSLGQTATNSYSSVSANDAITFLQVIQIGANLIDQYDTDSFPTRITLSVNGLATEVDGIENLPYLVSVYATPYQNPTGTIGMWLQPEVWNPHGQAVTPPSAPTQFQFIAFSGNVHVAFSTPGSGAISPDPNLASIPGIQFSAGNFSEPTLISSPTISPTASGFLGLNLGSTTDPAAPNSYTSATLTPTSNLIFQLQYQYNGGPWVTYSQMRSVTTSLTLTMPDHLGFLTYAPQVCITRSDPRTDRFGIVSATVPPNLIPAPPTGPTLWPAPATIYATSGYATSTVSGRTTTWLPSSWGATSSVGTLSDNTSPTYYIDPDGGIPTGTPRPADGAYSDGTAADGGYPLATGATTSRPYILNRPFQSVAEMGYAFRDEPWKHLDFFRVESADAALLDLFCLNESPYPSNPTVFPSAIAEAGRVNLNTRQATVLQAVLLGAIMAEDDSTTIAAPEAKNLASNLITLTTTLPLLNRSELVTRWISAVPTATFDSTSDAIIKRRREAAVRALADVGNTRTWNLLIDVIAQSGRYGPTAANLNQFIVEGERRYWLHVAIDRYTNKVVAQYLEPVYE